MAYYDEKSTYDEATTDEDTWCMDDDDDDLSFYEETQDTPNISDGIRSMKMFEPDPLNISDGVRSIQLSDIDPLNVSDGVRSLQEISLDLGDLLDEIEDSEELHLEGPHGGDCDQDNHHREARDLLNKPNCMASSKLQWEDLPSSTETLDWGNVKWKDIFGSSKLIRKTSIESLRRSPKKPTAVIPRKKTVRFKKFETVFHY